MRSSANLLVCVAAVIAGAAAPICAAQSAARLPGELAWTIGYDPKTFDPAKVDEQESETIRRLTAGRLLRFNRLTQQVEPELAQSWRVSGDGRTVTLILRPELQFSDGSRLTAKDVVWSIRRVLLPATAAPVAEEFLSPDAVTVSAPDDQRITIQLPKRVIAIERVFDEIAIEPAGRATEGRVTAGPFFVAEYRRSQFVRLRRNPHYFKKDPRGISLPYAAGIRLDIVNNPEQQVRLLLRGAYDLIEGLSPEYFEMLKQKAPSFARDLGASLNTEQLWFNQAPGSPLPAWEKVWFESKAFRMAVSAAIRREDLVRLAYAGHATPAYNFISPANSMWYRRILAATPGGLNEARAALSSAGFQTRGGALYDASGHRVKFSILTNAGNTARMKMASLIQQDLAGLGMEITIVTLDFPALIERLLHTQDYEACLLGLENVDPEPNAMMNIWLSSSPNHQWNPSEKTPATDWEAEIDRAMNLQAGTANMAERKRAIDKLQQIVADQQPFIYLVYPNVLYAISPHLRGVQPAVIQPGLTWNPENLQIGVSR